MRLLCYKSTALLLPAAYVIAIDEVLHMLNTIFHHDNKNTKVLSKVTTINPIWEF